MSDEVKTLQAEAAAAYATYQERQSDGTAQSSIADTKVNASSAAQSTMGLAVTPETPRVIE